MIKKEILKSYLEKNRVPETIARRINPDSMLTEHFAYGALRVGNSIGDLLDISTEIIILEEIAKKFGLEMNTVEHAELHSLGSEEKDLDSLVRAALVFEKIRSDKNKFHDVLAGIREMIRQQAVKLIEK